MGGHPEIGVRRSRHAEVEDLRAAFKPGATPPVTPEVSNPTEVVLSHAAPKLVGLAKSSNQARLDRLVAPVFSKVMTKSTVQVLSGFCVGVPTTTLVRLIAERKVTVESSG